MGGATRRLPTCRRANVFDRLLAASPLPLQNKGFRMVNLILFIPAIFSPNFPPAIKSQPYFGYPAASADIRAPENTKLLPAAGSENVRVEGPSACAQPAAPSAIFGRAEGGRGEPAGHSAAWSSSGALRVLSFAFVIFRSRHSHVPYTFWSSSRGSLSTSGLVDPSFSDSGLCIRAHDAKGASLVHPGSAKPVPGNRPELLEPWIFDLLYFFAALEVLVRSLVSPETLPLQSGRFPDGCFFRPWL